MVMKRTILFILALACVVVASHQTPAAAGGWAITSLDPFDQPVAGRQTVIGLTILQHGVTPVDLADVGIRVTGPGGPSQFFPAVSDAPDRVGHYTADVVFPSAGTFSWIVEQDIFGPQDLGRVTVTGAAGGSSVTGEAGPGPAILRYGLPLVAALCIAIIIRELGRGRRRLTAG